MLEYIEIKGNECKQEMFKFIESIMIRHVNSVLFPRKKWYAMNKRKKGKESFYYRDRAKKGCNRGHGFSAAIKLGTPDPNSCIQVVNKANPLFGSWSKNGFTQKRL